MRLVSLLAHLPSIVVVHLVYYRGNFDISFNLVAQLQFVLSFFIEEAFQGIQLMLLPCSVRVVAVLK